MSFIARPGPAYRTPVAPRVAEPEAEVATASSSLLAQLPSKLRGLVDALSSTFPGREEQAEAVVVGLVSGLPVFLMAPPGTAKTAMVEYLSKLVDGASYFYYLLSQYTEPDELLGPVDVRALREGVYRRNTKGRLPEAHIVFLDEIFKASSAIRNVLLDIILNKRILNGDEYTSISMRALYTASNEVPEDEEDQAIYDRLVIRSFFDYVPDNKLEDVILRGVVYSNTDERPRPLLALADVDAAQGMARKMAMELARNPKIRSAVIKAVVALRSEGVQFSDRRVVQLFRVVAALALARGQANASVVEVADAILYTAPMTPEHVAEVEKVIEKSGILTDNRVLEELEQLLKEADSLLRQYAKSHRVDDLVSARRVLDRAEKVAESAHHLPRSIRTRLESLVAKFNRAARELDELRG